MQQLKFSIFLICFALDNVIQTFAAIHANATLNLHYTEDALILQKCLTDKGGKDLQKVLNFGSWNNGEEVPCFTRCLSVAKGWFEASESKWVKQKIIADLGEDLWKYCQYELERKQDNECEYVHQGFRCLRKAEENTRQTYMTLLNCAIELGSDLNDLQIYDSFPEQEHIPCLFKCFAEKMALFGANFEWNFTNWTTAFGPFDVEAAALTCHKSKKQNDEDECAWMYKEYLCLKQIDDSESSEVTIAISTQNTEEATSEISQKSVGIESGSTFSAVAEGSIDLRDKSNATETDFADIVAAKAVLPDKIETVATAAAVAGGSVHLRNENNSTETVATAAAVSHESNDHVAAAATVSENIANQNVQNETIETVSKEPPTVAQDIVLPNKNILETATDTTVESTKEFYDKSKGKETNNTAAA